MVLTMIYNGKGSFVLYKDVIHCLPQDCLEVLSEWWEMIMLPYSNRYRTFKVFIFLLLFMMTLPMLTMADNQGEGQLVYVIPVEHEVEKGLYAFLKRSINEAEEAGANHIIFEIDSPGGLVDSANKIGTLLQGLDTPYSAFIINQALSAGSYIA